MKIMIFLLLISTNSSSFADISRITGKNLLEMCQNSLLIEDTKTVNPDVGTPAVRLTSSGMCLGYLLGVEDIHIFYSMAFTANHHPNKNLFMYCLPNYTDQDVFIRVIVKYLNDHPEELNQPALMAVINAYHQYYPCSK